MVTKLAPRSSPSLRSGSAVHGRSLRVTDMIFAANALEDRGDYRDAFELFLVAADLAEEDGDDDRAARLRGRARRIAVLEAAQRQWPAAKIDLVDVRMVTPRDGTEYHRFLILGLSMNVVVTLDETGHLRILDEDV